MRMDHGSYPGVPFGATLFPGIIETLLPGPYRIKGYSFDSSVLLTNKCAYVAYRGPWAMETWTRERLLDVVAREIDLDPANVRRVNMTDGNEGDRMITGPTLRGVSSRQTLERVLELIRVRDALRKEQAEARREGRFLGIGFATFIEAAPGPPEMRFGTEQAGARLEADGHLVIYTAQTSHGQGHETTLAQIAADEMGIPFSHVKIVARHTRLTPFSRIGTGGSRAATWASGASSHLDAPAEGEGARDCRSDARDQPSGLGNQRRRHQPQGRAW